MEKRARWQDLSKRHSVFLSVLPFTPFFLSVSVSRSAPLQWGHIQGSSYIPAVAVGEEQHHPYCWNEGESCRGPERVKSRSTMGTLPILADRRLSHFLEASFSTINKKKGRSKREKRSNRDRKERKKYFRTKAHRDKIRVWTCDSIYSVRIGLSRDSRSNKVVGILYIALWFIS